MEDRTASSTTKERLRALPSIDELLGSPTLREVLSPHPRARSVAALRSAVQRARERLLRGEPRGFEEADVHAALNALTRPNLRAVQNATGVVLHTNLGRAPLPPAALERIAQISGGYCNLEYDLDEGARGSRFAPVVPLLRALTGAEDAVVVNNCAAAVLLALSALAAGKEVVVSRGELVEVGGGFRIPDVMRQSGARLVEVGTTNRTRLADYERAMGPDTALLLQVHPSNFAVVGFTEAVSTQALAGLAHARGLPLVCDLGAGRLAAEPAPGLSGAPTVRSFLEAGADGVMFSGDKLLGGPQAGILVGRRTFLDRVRSHPLSRALRVDKLTVAALEATLELYRDGRTQEIPALALLNQSPENLRTRAERLCALLESHGVRSAVEQVEGQVGGGSLPLARPVSFACTVSGGERLLAALREGSPPVIARLSEGRVVLDVLCLGDAALEAVAQAVREAKERSC